MKIALVHDWLNQKAGGAEQVLAHLANMFPEAPIYTLIYNPDIFDYSQDRIHASFLNKAPHALKKRSRYLLPLVPHAVESWDFSDFDVVISSSCAFTKNIITDEHTHHISYTHSPMRFAWDYWPKYLNEQSVGPIRRMAIRRMVHHARLWDFAGAARVDTFIANSQTTHTRISKYYRRESQIIYPPAELHFADASKGDYFVTLGMLTPYKKVDLAIEAFNVSGKKLKVIGDGPERQRLEAMAEDNIEFVGFVSEKERTKLLSKAQGLIFPHVEDFGIAPIDAMAAGCPVIAYNQGGATETVLNGRTGVLFDHQSPRAINAAINEALSLDFQTKELHQQAEKFSSQHFRNAIMNIVNQHGPK